jgi:glycerol-3-phosphate dehydrogenase
MLQQPDRRIVFAIPWVGGTTMVGTTEEQVDTPEAPSISDAETDYLLTAANTNFVRQSAKSDISYTWAGVRPLVDDGTGDNRTTTRDYILEVNADGAPLLNVLGGKITTARHLAEDAMIKLGSALAKTVFPVTRERPFPGGKLPVDFETFVARCQTLWPFLGSERAERMARAYGNGLARMLLGVTDDAGMGTDFGHGLTQVEVDWLMATEWAKTADDILWRRTKLGLAFEADQVTALERYLKKVAVATHSPEP